MGMIFRRTLLLVTLIFSTKIALGSNYDCQLVMKLTQQCAQCQMEKNCNSYHSINCPKIPSYKKKCQDFLTKSIEENKQKNPYELLEKSPYPIQQNNNREPGSDLNAVIPDQPKPAPGMENTVPDKSKTLTPPPSNFILRGWY